MKLLGKLICKMVGHKRGKRVISALSVTLTDREMRQPGQINSYRCPRCHATWTRKIKKSGVSEQLTPALKRLADK